MLRRARLWVARNRTLAASAKVLLVMLAKVVVDGQRAALAIRRLAASAPVFAAQALELLKGGDFSGILEAARQPLTAEMGGDCPKVLRRPAPGVAALRTDKKGAGSGAEDHRSKHDFHQRLSAKVSMESERIAASIRCSSLWESSMAPTASLIPSG